MTSRIAQVFRRAAPAIAAATAFFTFASFAVGAGVAIVSGPSVSDAEITATSAIVRWRTDVESTTVVRFGKTTALGQEYKKIIPIEETEVTEVVHSMTLAGLDGDTTYFYVAHSTSADGTASVDSPMQSFHTHAACEADTWQCSDWGTCNASTSTQARSCTLTNDCPDVATPRPAESQACTPACTEDTWECTAFGACSASGSQTRACTLKTDCPTAQTPKPAESQSCTPSCSADTWNCTAYGACDAETRQQTRTCTLKTDCPTATTPKPAESRSCTVATQPPPAPPEPAPTPAPVPPPAPTCSADVWECGDWGVCVATDGGGARTRNCALKTDCPTAETEKPAQTEACEPAPTGSTPPPVIAATGGLMETLGDEGAATTVTINTSPGGIDPNSPPDQPYSVTLVGTDPDTLQGLVRECRDNGILADRCAAWLEAKYQDRRCLDAGKTSREACEGYLSGLNGGTFPGCEGRTDSECGAVKAKALLGYLPDAAKRKFDAALQGALDAGRPVETIDGLTAVRPEVARDAIWWPSLPGDGQHAAPAMVIRDTDKDGLPDDLEVRMGWDPKVSDTQNGAKRSREVLKSFFQTGDKPTQFVFVDADGDGSIDFVEDRKLLGLKNYDPARVYLPGDTSRRATNMFGALFSGDGGLLVGVDLDGDGSADAKVSRNVLKSFFQTGDKPTQPQFSSFIDSAKFAPADLALITGHAIGQPVGDGEVDPTFTVLVDMDVDQPDMAATDTHDANQPFLGTPPKDSGPGLIECSDDKNCPPEYPQCIDRRCIGDGYDANGPPPQLSDDGDLANGSYTLRGTAAPNSVVVLYVYSYVPMVLTTTTDENGNYTYDVSDSVVDGEHTAYVAVTDDTGKVTKKSGPLSFFVKEAQAVSEDEFESADVNVPTEPVAQWQRSYLIGAAVAVLVALIGVWLLVARKLGPDQPAAQPPAEPPKA